MADLKLADVLERVKEDIDIEDNLQDKMLKRLITKVLDHFKLEYGQTTVREEFSFIIEDCTIKRYNRRRAEGATTRSIEGYSLSFEDKDEFAEYDDLIRKTLELDNHGKVTPGRLMFF